MCLFLIFLLAMVVIGNGIMVYSMFRPATEHTGYYVPAPEPIAGAEDAITERQEFQSACFNCKWNLRRSNPGPVRRWGRKPPPGTRRAARCRRQRRLAA